MKLTSSSRKQLLKLIADTEIIQCSSGWCLCTQESPCVLHPVSQKLLRYCLWNSSIFSGFSKSLWGVWPFQGRSSSTSSCYASPLQAINDVICLTLYPQTMSEAPQHLHFRSSKTQAACDSCFASQSVCLVIFLDSSVP